MPTLDGIHFTESGNGTPPLVLVHGFTCDQSDWAGQISHLSQDFRVIALDLPGHGESVRGEPSISNFGSAVATLVHQLELSDAVLVGHSLGCRVVLEAVANCRDRVNSLILVDGSRMASTEAEYETLAAKVNPAGYADFAGGLFSQMFSDKAPVDIRERVVARCLGFDPDWASELFTNMGQWDVQHMPMALAKNELPLLAVQTTTIANAGHRRTLGANEASSFTDYLKASFTHSNSRIEVIADTGHFPQFEEIEQLNSLIAGFVASTS